jgi:hypothetical protein
MDTISKALDFDVGDTPFCTCCQPLFPDEFLEDGDGSLDCQIEG